MSTERKRLAPHCAFRLINQAHTDDQAALSVIVQAIADRTVATGHFGSAIMAAATLPRFDHFFTFDARDPAATFAPRPAWLFPEDPPLDTLVVSVDERRDNAYAERLYLSLPDAAMVRLAADTLLWLAGDQRTEPPSAALVASLEQAGCLSPTEERAPAAVVGAGIHRLQHASLLYAHGGRSVLIDPVLHTIGYGGGADDWPLLQAARHCSAILISHSHGDHFEPSSLAFFPRHIPVVVPWVAQTNILTPSFVAPLRAMGFTTIIEARWWETALRLGDMTVTALPFYGEQPRSRGGMRDPRLRNIGNTYLIETPVDRSWFVVDTGNEVAGNMKDVATRVLRQFGPVDHVASNLAEFHARMPTYITGSGTYWACLTNSDAENFADLKSECLTLGPSGVADLIAACAGRRFIPYADWWGEINHPSKNQAALISQLRDCLAAMQVDCDIAEINIGSAVPFGRAVIADGTAA
ncbi:MBL fold metallo-hydrolase [[Empedobacter] haloabium]|uniref:MBL fold metallo-hydrolase n=1 Tax=[Empedobacter] haloabium TaxID=592317 RepID=A0ABZ1UFT3_9BURK